jgi:replicative DNA helicase
VTDNYKPDLVNTLKAPQALLAEVSVIGALMLDRDAIIRVAPYLKPDHFGSERCRMIYEAILDLYARRIPADPVMLYTELERKGQLESLGGASELADIAKETPTAVHIDYYARIVVEYALRRALLTTGGNIAALAYDEQTNVESLLGRAQQLLMSLYERSGPQSYMSIADLANEYLDRLDAMEENPGRVAGISTGFTRLDQLTGGLRMGSFIVVAARPAIGKTTWVTNVAHHAAKQGHAVGIFTLEMGGEELMGKMISIETGISSDRLASGYLNANERTKVQAAIGALSVLPISIDDKSNLSITDLASKATQMQAERGLDLLIVDYLQLVHGTPRKNGLREQEVSEVARGLKEIARSLRVPVLACCQLNRMVEQRSDKVPQLSDLRESGEIEQAADIVLFIHREEEYDKSSLRAGIADLHLKKHRNGPTAVISLFGDMKCGRFGDLTIR